MKRLVYILLFIGFIAGSTAAPKAPFNRGVNFSSWFQENSVNLVGFTKYTKHDFINVKNMGADAIRLPVNFYAMTSGSPDYVVSTLLFTMLDTVVAWAEEEKMYLILDNHSYDPSFNAHPDLKNILSKMWMQIADHYKDRSQYLLYEIINEPAGFTDAVWADMMQTVVSDIRKKDAVHTIVVSPLEWSSYRKLSALPMFADKNLLYTIHFYGPFLFTHQGADWVGLDSLAGLPFPYGASPMPAVPAKYKGTWVEADLLIYNTGGTVQRLKEQIGIAAKFASTRNVPVWCGEFGVYSPKVIPEQRVFWYDTVSKILESQGIAWTIWGYHYAFGIFNTTTWGDFEHDVNIPLVKALGFTPPAQTPYVKKMEVSELVIYDDYLSPGVHNVSLTSGQVNMYNEKFPATGRYAISATKFKMPDAISFLFLKDKDLSKLKNEGYALEFKLRTGYAGKFAVRFLDTKTSTTDRPWRAQATVTVNTVNPSKDWQTISIPLSDFKDAGAWDAKWYAPEGKFDWTAIEKLEISASFASFGDSVVYFDQIRIRIPGSPEPVIVKPAVTVSPDTGAVEPVLPSSIISAQPDQIPESDIIIASDTVVATPPEVAIIPEPELSPTVDTVVDQSASTLTDSVVIPVSVVIPTDDVAVIVDPQITSAKDSLVATEPVVAAQPEPVVALEPEEVISDEVVVTVDPQITTAKDSLVATEPVVAAQLEPVVALEPEEVISDEVAATVDPQIIPVKDSVVVTEPVVAAQPEPVVALEPEEVISDEVAATVDPQIIPAKDSVVAEEPVVAAQPEPVVALEPEEVLSEGIVATVDPQIIPVKDSVVVTEPVVAAQPETVVALEPEEVLSEEIMGTVDPQIIPAKDSVVAEEPVVAAQPEPVVALEPEEVLSEGIVATVDPQIAPAKDSVVVTEPVGVSVIDDTSSVSDGAVPVSEIVEHDSIVTLRPEQIFAPKPIVDTSVQNQIGVAPDVVLESDTVKGPEMLEEAVDVAVLPEEGKDLPESLVIQEVVTASDSGDTETNTLILTPKTVAEVPVQVVITLQPTPDVPDDLPLDTTVVEENYTDAIDPTLTVTEGTGDFSPVSEILDSEEDVVDTSKADLANVDEPDEQLIDSSAGSGSTKQMVTTSEAQNKAEPYYFRLENGWLIIESQQEVKVITILDASLRLMRKEEGTNKILLDLPSGNYFVTVKFADGKEIIESAHF